MTTWIIGDVHGCVRSLEALLEAGDFHPLSDRLWSVGDLVNRGPDSLAVLRFFHELGERAEVVLGNHDLYLLARAAGLPARPRDTLDAVLAAPDRAELIDWLRRRPLLLQADDKLVFHAALAPDWKVADAVKAARRLEAALRAEGWRATILDLFAGRAPNDLSTATAWLTRGRMIDARGRFFPGYAGPPADAPPGLVHWAKRSRALREGVRAVYGHWAAQGHVIKKRSIALDSGCVWGRQLTAYALEDGRVVQVDCADVIPRG